MSMACGRWRVHGPFDMTAMISLARRYVAHRRKMGYQYGPKSVYPLIAFARFADRESPGRPLTTALALRWATSRPTLRPTAQAELLGCVRCFARYCALLDPRTEIPPSHLLGPARQRHRPHIFTKRQIGLILNRTRALPGTYAPLARRTYETLLGLLACTGMRLGEALRLQLSDLDTDSGLLRIAPCKSSPERLIPLDPTAVRALQHYRRHRRRIFPSGEHLFVGATGRPVIGRTIEVAFQKLTQGITPNGERLSLRLLDFRHTFTSRWIAEWSRQSNPVSHHLLLLARYLGHLNFRSTWWYVTSDPASLRSASEAFRHSHERGHV